MNNSKRYLVCPSDRLLHVPKYPFFTTAELAKGEYLIENWLFFIPSKSKNTRYSLTPWSILDQHPDCYIKQQDKAWDELQIIADKYFQETHNDFWKLLERFKTELI